jgi:Rhodanese-related sulfurtransferase
MSQKIVKGYKQLLAEANEVVQTIDIETALNMYQSDEYVFVDIRDYRELKRDGKIPGAVSCPRGMLEFWVDPESPYHKEMFNQDKTYVFYCSAAWRSALATRTVKEMGLSPVYHLEVVSQLGRKTVAR